MFSCVCVLGDEGRAGGMREIRREGKGCEGGGGVELRLWPLLQGLMWKLSTALCDFTLMLLRGPALPLTVLQW